MNIDSYWLGVGVLGAVLFLWPRSRRRRGFCRFRPRRHVRTRPPHADRRLSPQRTHAVTQQDARLALAKFDQLSHPGSRFLLLRGINHFVFEELILTALERKGHLVIRNARYTGDGGIDGRVMLQGKPVLIQAKRYKGNISRTDVAAFGHQCLQHNTTGLFVHTGKTPKATWHDLRTLHPQVQIISGERLLNLLECKAVLPISR